MENKLKTVDAETLLSTPMSKTMFIVDNLIPQGVNFISGASKIGKSWLMLWLGLQVAQGLPVWGLTTQQCDVLYLSLEDTQRRIKDRLYNLTDTAPSNLYFAVMCGLIGGGLEEQIADFLSDHPKTKLVIIDTLQKVRDTKGGAGKTGMYGNDYDDISSIKRIADEYNISVLLVHHLRKLKDSDDPFNEVSGSTGIIGAADTNYVFKRKRSTNAAMLLVSGRDMEYKMKLEAIKHQGVASSQLGTRLIRSDEKVALDAGESRNQIQRYIRLTYLIPELLSMVDDNKIAFNPAVEISYLDKSEQRVLLDAMNLNDCTPSHAQSIRLKKLSQDGVLDDQMIYAVMSEEKPNQQEQIKFKREDLKKYFPAGYTDEQMRRDIIKGLELLKRQRERNRDAR